MPFGDVISRDDAGALMPIVQSKEIIQAAEEKSSFLSLARQLPNMTTGQESMPVLDGLPLAYFVDGDNGLIQTTKLKWRNVYVYAEKIAVIVPVSQNVLDDNMYDIWGEAMPKIREAIGVVIDSAVYVGTAKPSRWPTAIIPGAVAAGNVVLLNSFSGGIALYDATLGESGLNAMIEADGFDVNGHVGVVAMKSKLRSVKDTTNQPVFQRSMQDKARYELDGEPMFFPKTKPFDATDALMISGDFSQAVWAMRTDMRYKLFDSGSIVDGAGNTIVNLLQQDQIALRVTIRLGWALPNPLNRLNPNNGTRYPFGVLKAS
jgi:HK97 family phage major capsid protein